MIAWVRSERCELWHAVALAARGPVLIGACGHPIAGRVHRRLARPGRACDSCLVRTAVPAR